MISENTITFHKILLPYILKNVQRTAFIACFLFVLSVFLGGCKASRKAVPSSPASDKIRAVFDAGGETASSAKTSSSPAEKPVKPTGLLTRYPAPEYYGNSWNTEHVRYSAAKPSGTAVLNMIPAGTNTFVMPVCGNILSEFGPRNDRMHTGIDIKLQMNDPVYCAFDGMVRMAQTYGDYGKMVVVRHDNGLETLYSHLNSISVKENQRIKAGDRIGGGGRTGRATGVHLHFETRFQGEPFNPRLVVDFDKCQLISESLVLNDESYKLYYKNRQAAAASADIASKQKEHIVEKGDTLYNISRRYGTTVDSLRRLNRLPESSILEIGQKLIVEQAK